MKRRNKYRAVRTVYLGETYDSQAEARYAFRLEMLRRAGEVKQWWRGMPVTLIAGPSRAESVSYRPDFMVTYTDGTERAIDVKGVVQREFRIKALLWRQRFPTMPLVVVDGNGNEIDIFARRKNGRRISKRA